MPKIENGVEKTKEKLSEAEMNYFHQRCNAIGLTPELNVLLVPESPGNPTNTNFIEFPLLVEDEKTGDILIPLYDLKGNPAVFNKFGTAAKTGTITASRATPIEVRRYKPGNERKTKEDKLIKYENPKGAKTIPWTSPNIIDAYRSKSSINTIIITEGYIKAISGYLNGLYIFGLAGIQNAKDKDTATLHPDIIAVITELNVQNVVLLYDGDCNNISLTALNEGKDLYKRPYGFFASARNICELLKDHRKNNEFDIYFAHVNSAELEGEPKGLDDLYEKFASEFTGITKEITSFSRQKNYYFNKFNITFNLSKVLSHLHINSQEIFYTFHNQTIGEKEFVFNGTKYQFNIEKNELRTIIPGAAKNYFRVGDTYYEKVKVPNKYSQVELAIHRRLKETITQDYGRNFIKHVSKYKAFCNVPDHVNYQEVIFECYNRYGPFVHSPGDDTECSFTLGFLQHIFGDQYEVGLDYIQILYTHPTQILPILCLVSKENNTGKSTFAKWLKALFTNNMVIVGNSELEDNFNASYADKLIICCDEAFIDKKKVIEKIKSLSTASKITLNQKGKDHVEIDFFGKFLLLTNNEENFITATEDDIRYWVRKINVPKMDNPDLEMNMLEEIPAFLRLLSDRIMHTERQTRMWFTREQIATEALNKVIQYNKPSIEKELRTIIKNMFLDYGLYEIKLSAKVIGRDLLKNKHDQTYVEKIMREKFNVKCSEKSERYKYPATKLFYENNIEEYRHVLNGDIARPYQLKAVDFCSSEEYNSIELSEFGIMMGQTDQQAVEQKTLGLNSDDLPF